MQSIREFYKIGNGPSSSHTMGPKRASLEFKETYHEADEYQVILYGSLAFTGKGHLTDKIIQEAFFPKKVEIVFDKKTECKIHPNTMDLKAFKDNKEIGNWRVYSIGGGSIQIEGKAKEEKKDIYPITTLNEIKDYCIKNEITLSDYVYQIEDTEIKEYLSEVWKAMKNAVEEGIKTEGEIPGKLNLRRRAREIYEKTIENESMQMKQSRMLTAYAYAVSETNACGGIIVTAPTCGASGVLPSVLYYLYKEENYKENEIIDGLATAALIGNLVKENASISGAECGCQAEVGTACSMAAAADAEIKRYSMDQIESAAETAMEHHLGLTCDPIYGYVQIPCIERNAVASMRAIDSANIAYLVAKSSKISFDMVVDTMYETGKDLQSHYRETSEGGLAKKYCRNKYYNPNLKQESEEASKE